MQELARDAFKAVFNIHPLICGKMQRLIGLIAEECILAYFPAERSTEQEIGVEQNATESRTLHIGHGFIKFNRGDLSRTKKHHRLVVVVISRATIIDRTPFGLFQKNSIQPPPGSI